MSLPSFVFNSTAPSFRPANWTSLPLILREHIYSLDDDRLIGQTTQLGAQALHWIGLQESDLDALTLNGSVGSLLQVTDHVEIAHYQKQALSQREVPILFGWDVIHGFATAFPQSIGLAASFDTDLVYRVARAMAEEAMAADIRWLFAPNSDVTRDARWGRMAETSGEDTYLTGQMTAAYVKGIQSTGAAACVKHLAAYGAPVAGRDYNPTLMSAQLFFNDYFPPYKHGLEVGSLTAMTSYNALNGVPAVANVQLFNNLIRGAMQWDGVVVSDYLAVHDLVDHQVARNDSEAVYLAQATGVDVSMGDANYLRWLKGELFNTFANGALVREHVEASVRRIVSLKYKLGLFDQPLKPTPYHEENFCTPETLKLAEEASVESIVLLKRDRSVLPLNSEKSPRLLLVGSVADSVDDTIGSWPVVDICKDKVVSIKAALADHGAAKYLPGYSTAWTEEAEDESLRAEIETEISDGDFDAVILVVGEAAVQNGETASRTDLTLPASQAKMIRSVHAAAKARGSESPALILVIAATRPQSIAWEKEHMDAIMMAWPAGHMAGPGLKKILYGERCPSGRMPVTSPHDVSQLPLHYSIPNATMWTACFEDNPVYWERRPDDIGSWKNTCRITHIAAPLWPFGHGLSYEEFEYVSLDLEPKMVGVNATRPVIVTVTVRRKGIFDGPVAEVIQLYTQAKKARSIYASTKKLRRFERVKFERDEMEKVVRFELNIATDLAYYDSKLIFGVDRGDYRVVVGRDSWDEVLRETLTVV